MELRDHPLCRTGVFRTGLLSGFAGMVTYLDASEAKSAFLKEVRTAMTLPHKRFLVIKHEQREYIGCLFFSDRTFCEYITKLLQEHCGDSIEHIGSLDLSHTF